MKNIAILGSTGSIGIQTLDVIRQFQNRFRAVALSTNTKIDILEKEIEEFRVRKVAVANEEKYEELVERARKGKGKALKECEILKGAKGLEEIAVCEEADTIVTSFVGAMGIVPTLKAIEAGKNIALANKETLVSAGEVVMSAVEKNGVNLMPIDSEHSAIFQCIHGEKKKNISKIIITASGGAFRDYTREQLKNVKAGEALKHPTWNMGDKITIDSATLMNKGLEVIEAHWLYSVPYERIDTIMHPQSIVHSLVEFVDGSVIAQLGLPDMRLPIQYALSYPERLENNELKRLDLKEKNNLTFRALDTELFPCLKYAYEAGKKGGTLPSAMNAANEVAGNAFLKDKIGFYEVAKTIRKVMDKHRNKTKPSISQILDADKEARKEAEKIINGL